ncbi:hypothetical protein RFI_01598 [Reticulomyxa filosa]|uniref:TRAF-type domain-containing protein n=1 Tax=Reticulomyxa filosa TaxID=46433 RepID=X6PAB3_RETFI|nr:hypothetical protein RFI_01598 [Reticulomyxa filosa]|eukprot:ETO35465.1 hypothetical protein RFI_01598 [Reticulomyxa filosa]
MWQWIKETGFTTLQKVQDYEKSSIHPNRNMTSRKSISRKTLCLRHKSQWINNTYNFHLFIFCFVAKFQDILFATLTQFFLLNQQGRLDHLHLFDLQQVDRNSIECTQYQDLNEMMIDRANCLKQFLSGNPNSCHIQSHNDCLYPQSRVAQFHIGDLRIKYPRQFQQGSQTIAHGQQPKGEGDEKMTCDFEGKINELNDHLENSCSLKLYKQFGYVNTCSKQKLQQYLILKLKFHFDLIVTFVDSLKQTIQFHQDHLKTNTNKKIKWDEITQLKLQLESNKKRND